MVFVLNQRDQTSLNEQFLSAVRVGDRAAALKVWEEGARSEAIKGKNRGAFQCVRHPEAVKFLVELGLDPSEKDDFLNTKLHNAAAMEENDLVAELIKFGADVDAQNKGGNTPLHCAVLSGNKEATELLINAGAGVDLKNGSMRTPLCEAIIRNKPQIIGKLLLAGAELKEVSPDVQEEYSKTIEASLEIFNAKTRQKTQQRMRSNHQALRNFVSHRP